MFFCLYYMYGTVQANMLKYQENWFKTGRPKITHKTHMKSLYE